MLQPRNLSSTSDPPLVTEILTNELWYGDGQPSWHRAPSAEQAVHKRIAYIKRLRRFADTLRSATATANRLETCAPHHRCMSGACPECNRAFQRWFVHSTEQLINVPEPQGELITASIVFPSGWVPFQLTNTLSMENLKRAVTRSIEGSSDVEWIVGGVDISLNDDRQKSLGLGWQVQLYAIAMVNDREAFGLLLRKQFHQTARISRPVQIKTCDGSLEAISYAFKTDFVRRIAYRGQTTTNGKSREYWTTRKVSLPPIDHADLLVRLHTLGLAQRLYLRGVRMTVTKNGVALVKLGKQE
jgi:hypothetical protein